MQNDGIPQNERCGSASIPHSTSHISILATDTESCEKDGDWGHTHSTIDGTYATIEDSIRLSSNGEAFQDIKPPRISTCSPNDKESHDTLTHTYLTTKDYSRRSSVEPLPTLENSRCWIGRNDHNYHSELLNEAVNEKIVDRFHRVIDESGYLVPLSKH